MSDEIYLSRQDLSAVTRIPESQIREWVKHEVIPPRLCPRYSMSQGQPTIFFRPVVMAIAEFLAELQDLFGTNSRAPKMLLPQAIPTIEEAWQTPGELRIAYMVHGPAEIRLPLSCVHRAKAKLVNETVTT